MNAVKRGTEIFISVVLWAVILLAVAYLLFSILPPTGRLFAEQAGVPAASIPF